MHYSIQIDADNPSDLAAAIAGLLQVNAHITVQTKIAQAQLAQRGPGPAVGQVADTIAGHVVTDPKTGFQHLDTTHAGEPVPEAVTAEKVDPPKQPRRKKTDPVQPALQNLTLTPEPTATETVKEQLAESVAQPTTPPADLTEEDIRKPLIAYGNAVRVADLEDKDAMTKAIKGVYDALTPSVDYPNGRPSVSATPANRRADLLAVIKAHHDAFTKSITA